MLRSGRSFCRQRASAAARCCGAAGVGQRWRQRGAVANCLSLTAIERSRSVWSRYANEVQRPNYSRPCILKRPRPTLRFCRTASSITTKPSVENSPSGKREVEGAVDIARQSGDELHQIDRALALKPDIFKLPGRGCGFPHCRARNAVGRREEGAEEAEQTRPRKKAPN